VKKILLGLCIFIFSASLAQSRYLSFKDGYVSQRKFNDPQRTITNSDSYIDVEYKFDGAYLKHISEGNGNGYLHLYMDNAHYITDEIVLDECSRLPYYKDLIVLTENANESTVKIEIIEENHQDFICPLIDTDESILSDASNYTNTKTTGERKSFYPDTLAYCVTKSTFRTVPLVSINTYPVSFNSTTKTLRCYSSIKYRINFEKQETPAKLSRMAYDMLGRASSNPEMLKKYDQTMLKSEASSKECDYLIVTTDAYKVAAEKMASWKTRLGYKCHILSKKKWEVYYPYYVADTIKAYCSKLKYMPDYLLIIGSDSDVPSTSFRNISRISMFSETSTSYSSDAPLAQNGISSVKPFDDMARGRISVYSPQEAISVVDKIISYESNPPAKSDFYNKALSISYFEYEGSPINHESKTFDFVSSAEGVSIDLKRLGYDIDRHYITCKEGQRTYKENSQPQYFLNGDKMPEGMYMEDPSGNDFWDKTPSHITDLLNDGKSIVVYDGHGNEGAYSFKTYTQEEVAKLKNGDKTPVFFNFTCSTGSFNYKNKDSLCFAECLLNKAIGGAVGVFGNSYPAVHCESKLMGSGTLEALFKNQEISIASAILQASFRTELDETRRIGHYFGDPSMRLYTVEPATFKPFINRGNDNSITVDSHVKGSKITICSIADYGKSYFKTFDASNETKYVFENVNVPCYITITKANYVPYVTVSKTDLYLQNMTLTGYHDIVANNIISGEKVTDQMKEGAFIVESGTTKLRSSKTLSLKSGTSVKYGASLRARKGDLSANAYKGDGKPRTADIPLCFNSLSERFSTNNLYSYENNNGSLSSVSDNESNSVSIYPNPTSGSINVEVDNNIINDVVVLDITGKVLMSESVNANNISLDLSSFAKGLYLVKVVTAEDSFVKKVVLK
jgi:hypothetical protein